MSKEGRSLDRGAFNREEFLPKRYLLSKGGRGAGTAIFRSREAWRARKEGCGEAVWGSRRKKGDKEKGSVARTFYPRDGGDSSDPRRGELGGLRPFGHL